MLTSTPPNGFVQITNVTGYVIEDGRRRGAPIDDLALHDSMRAGVQRQLTELRECCGLGLLYRIHDVLSARTLAVV